MAEPARKHKEIEPDIRPRLYDVNDVNENAARRRASFRDLNAGESNPEKPNTGSVVEQEANGSNVIKGPWKDRTTGNPKSSMEPTGFIAAAKKKSPIIAIIFTLFAGGIGIGGLISPAFLTQSIMAKIVDKFNLQETSMTIRTNKLIASKMTESTTVGSCTSFVTILCRFSRPSNRFLQQLEKNGITALDSKGNKIISGGILPNARTSKLRYTNSAGKEVDIPAKDLYKTLSTDVEFRTGLHNASMTRFQSLADEVFMRIKMKFGFTVADPLNKRIKADADLGLDGKSTKTASQSLESVVEDTVAIDKNVMAAIKDGGTAATEQLTEALTEEAVSEANTVNKSTSAATKFVSLACMLSNGPTLVTKAVRGFQMTQLIKYSAIFLTVFGAIKAGDATPEEVSAVGNSLTQVSNGKSAMDSFGMNYVINGDTAPQNNNYIKFAPGAAVILALAGVTAITNSTEKKAICNMAGNPVTGAGIDAALALNSGETMGITAGLAILDIALGMALGEVLSRTLPPLIEAAVKIVPVGDIMNNVLGFFVGDLTKGLVGENVGDALVSGASNVMGQTGNQGGNMPLTVTDAVAYAEKTKQVQLAYAEEDRATKSPFDITSPNTMLGSIVQRIVPYFAKSDSIGSTSSTIASIANVITGSFSTVFQPLTVSAADPGAEYTQCADPDLKDNDVAAGPFCNIIYGIPPKYLDKDPVTIVNELIASGDIDPESGEPIDNTSVAALIQKGTEMGAPTLKSWVDMCTDGKSDQANNCKITDETANFALYTIDHRIQKSMDEDPTPSSSSDNSSNTPSGETPTPDTSATDSKTMKELAKMIIDSGNVNDKTGQIKQIAEGTRTNLNIKILKLIANLAKDNKFSLSDLVRSKNANYGAKNSQHKVGQAVDFSGSSGINGTTIPTYGSYSLKIQTFLDEISSLLGGSCHGIGVPNTKYINSTDTKCSVFKDIGTGPHIHVGINP